MYTLWNLASMNFLLQRMNEPLIRGDKTRMSFPIEGAVYLAFRGSAVAFEQPRLPHFWARPGVVAPFIILPSLRHYRIILFYPRIFSSFHDSSSPARLFSNSIPVPAFLPSTLLRYRLSISRSTAVTFKRNLHNGVVWKSVFSAGTIAIVSWK